MVIALHTLPHPCYSQSKYTTNILTKSTGLILRMFQQFSMFEQYKKRLSRVAGEEEAIRIVNGALVLYYTWW
jgi:hypothetical protein